LEHCGAYMDKIDRVTTNQQEGLVATNDISGISWRYVLLLEEAGIITRRKPQTCDK